MKFLSMLLLGSLLSTAAMAEKIELVKCSDYGANLENLVPGPETSRSFYNQNVGMFVYNVEEPTVAPFGIAITFMAPEEAEVGVLRKCLAIPFLSEVSLNKAKSTYNAKTGLTVVVPVKQYDGEKAVTKNLSISIKTINTGKASEGQVLSAEIK